MAKSEVKAPVSTISPPSPVNISNLSVISDMPMEINDESEPIVENSLNDDHDEFTNVHVTNIDTLNVQTKPQIIPPPVISLEEESNESDDEDFEIDVWMSVCPSGRLKDNMDYTNQKLKNILITEFKLDIEEPNVSWDGSSTKSNNIQPHYNYKAKILNSRVQDFWSTYHETNTKHIVATLGLTDEYEILYNDKCKHCQHFK